MNVGSIAGGTHAGWRRVKPAHKPWVCRCYATIREPRAPRTREERNPGWMGECSDCGAKRPT